MKSKDTRILKDEVTFGRKDMDEQAEVSFKAGQANGLSLERQGEAYLEGRQAGISEVVGFVQPLLGRINDLVSDIRGDWTDPRTECRAIWDIINQWQAKLKEWEVKE